MGFTTGSYGFDLELERRVIGIRRARDEAARTDDDQPRRSGRVPVVALDMDHVAQGRGQLPLIAAIIDDPSTGADDVEPILAKVEGHGLEPHRDAELERIDSDGEITQGIAGGREQQQP